MAENQTTRSIGRRLFQGVTEGALWGGCGLLLVTIFRQGLAEGMMPLVQSFAVGAAVAAWLCGVGRVLAGGVAGALLGGLLGFLATLYSEHQPTGPQPGAGTPGLLKPGNLLEITGTTLDGTEFDLSAWRGRIVLVDFWATWCPPCVAEIPNVKRVYEKYHDQGFEIVGVSLDAQEAALRKFVKDKSLPWPQLFSANPELRGGNHPMVQRYAVASIPRMILVDQQGRIVDDDLRGGEVERALQRVLRGQPEGNSNLLIGLVMTFLVGPIAGAGIERLFRRALEAPPVAKAS